MILKIVSEVVNLIRDSYLFFRYYKKRVNLKLNKENSIVIGNGPSFSSFLENNRSIISEYELIVCNGFVSTCEFNLLKPENYCLLDPLYFDLDNEQVVNYVNDVLETWDNLVAKTNWPMSLYVSIHDSKKLKAIQPYLDKNKFLRIVNVLPIKFHSILKNYFYSNGIGLIGGMTVTHLSLQISILKQNKNIYLVGVDHDWFKNIRYDDDSNNVGLLNTHFYGDEMLFYGSGQLKEINLAIDLNNIAKSMFEFIELNEFAKLRCLNLYRASKSFLHFLPFKTIE
jgi:hypothetical protein